MSKQNETEKDEISPIDDSSEHDDLTDFERLSIWCKNNWKILAICAVMLVHTIIFVGIILSMSLRNSSDTSVSEQPPPPPPQEIEEPAPEPSRYPIGTINTPDDSDELLAYEAGLDAGERFKNSRDSLIDFWRGFDEATGASDWAREQWGAGRERINEWIDENYPPDDPDEN